MHSEQHLLDHSSHCAIPAEDPEDTQTMGAYARLQGACLSEAHGLKGGGWSNRPLPVSNILALRTGTPACQSPDGTRDTREHRRSGRG